MQVYRRGPNREEGYDRQVHSTIQYSQPRGVPSGRCLVLLLYGMEIIGGRGVSLPVTPDRLDLSR